MSDTRPGKSLHYEGCTFVSPHTDHVNLTRREMLNPFTDNQLDGTTDGSCAERVGEVDFDVLDLREDGEGVDHLGPLVASKLALFLMICSESLSFCHAVERAAVDDIIRIPPLLVQLWRLFAKSLVYRDADVSNVAKSGIGEEMSVL